MTPDESVLQQLVGTTTFRGLRVRPQWRRGGRVAVSRGPRACFRSSARLVADAVQRDRDPREVRRGRADIVSGQLHVPGPDQLQARRGAGARHAPDRCDAGRVVRLSQRGSGLSSTLSAPPEPVEPVVALQFEISAASAKGRGAPRPGPAQLGLRPVVRGTNGGWVRTGISWSNIGYVSDPRRGIAPDHLRLLNEIMQLDSSSSGATTADRAARFPLSPLPAGVSGTCWPRHVRWGCR